MANEVPESVSHEIPRPPVPRERPVLRAAPGPSPEELHGTIGPARNRMAPPPGSPEARLSDAAGMALTAAAGSSLPGAVALGASDVADAARNGMSPALALGLMTYGRSAARLADPRRAMRSLARNPGYDAHRLRRRTGYDRGVFGLGVETHGDATIKPSVLFTPGRVEGRIRDLAYMHRDVKIAYPGMENMKVRIVPDAEWRGYVGAARMPAAQRLQAYGANGFLEPGNGITIRGWAPGESLAQWSSRADAVLVHEMQHAAQAADAMRSPYARPDRAAYLADAREVEARNTADRRVFSGDERYQYLRRATQDMPPEAVHLADKGGDNHASFRNFLATDDVPDSLFGIPIVQDESRYTERDIEFFRENPKAAGFYDLGDSEDVGAQEAWGGANTVERVAHGLPRPEPKPAPRERPVMRAAGPRPASPTPAERPSLWGETEEEFWRTIPGANSVIPEMREYARSPENLLPEELARLERIRLRDAAIESGMATAAGAPASAKAAPVLLNDFRTGKYYRVPSLQVSEADVEAAARHFEKPASRIMPSDYAAWVNYELNGRKPYQYSQNVLGSGADVAIMNQPADIARRLMRMKGSASVDAFRSAGIRQVSALPRVRPVAPPSSDPPVLSPVEYQAWRDLRVLPLSSFYGNAYEAGVRTPFRASTHVDTLTPFRRLPGSGGRDYLEVLSEYDALPPATRSAVKEGLAHRHFIDLHVDPGAEAQAVRFGWQDQLGDPNVFLGGRSINPDTVFGGRLKSATENDKGGESKKTTRPAKPRGKYPGASNNPGNVEKHEIRSDKTLFEGEDGGGERPKRFARFTDPVLGLKASAVVLARKANALAKAGKPFTIANYAPFYAPESENDTKAYIRNLSAYSRIASNAEIDRWDTESIARLLKAKVRFETSPEASEWFTDAEYEEAAEKLQEGAFD